MVGQHAHWYELTPKPADTRVAVAMSGGVDSSVAAALLVERGYEVVGVMARMLAGQEADAQRVARSLAIPFHVVDLRAPFERLVVAPFIDAYTRQGITPNPCLICNRQIKFGALLARVLALGVDYMATGHYARIHRTQDGSYQLLKGRDAGKDQSYVLSVATQAELARVLYPLGAYRKEEVRALADRFGLPVAGKPDSQDLCFVPDGDYRRFINERAPQAAAPGPIVNRQGERLGTHTGLAHYTIGQRKGLGITYSEPLYVFDMHPQTNTLVVGTRGDLGRDWLTASGVNWVGGQAPAGPLQAEIKIRYRAEPRPATVRPTGPDSVHVQFAARLRDITPGQGAVFYQGELCLGGGIIDRV